MTTLCSKLRNGFLDLLGFGPVGIGVRPSLWRQGGTGCYHDFGRRLLHDIPDLSPRSTRLAEAAKKCDRVGLGRLVSTSAYRFEE